MPVISGLIRLRPLRRGTNVPRLETADPRRELCGTAIEFSSCRIARRGRRRRPRRPGPHGRVAAARRAVSAPGRSPLATPTATHEAATPRHGCQDRTPGPPAPPEPAETGAMLTQKAAVHEGRRRSHSRQDRHGRATTARERRRRVRTRLLPRNVITSKRDVAKAAKRLLKRLADSAMRSRRVPRPLLFQVSTGV